MWRSHAAQSLLIATQHELASNIGSSSASVSNNFQACTARHRYVKQGIPWIWRGLLPPAQLEQKTHRNAYVHMAAVAANMFHKVMVHVSFLYHADNHMSTPADGCLIWRGHSPSLQPSFFMGGSGGGDGGGGGKGGSGGALGAVGEGGEGANLLGSETTHLNLR